MWLKSLNLFWMTVIVAPVSFCGGYVYMTNYMLEYNIAERGPVEAAKPVIREVRCRDLIQRMALEHGVEQYTKEIEDSFLTYNEVAIPDKDKSWAQLAIGQILSDARKSKECKNSGT
jgi:hypothetical protein